MRFRKKPVVIEAWEWKGGPFQAAAPAWLLAYDLQELVPNVHVTARQVRLRHDGTLSIPTLEGQMTAQIGDWIIRGVKGEVYPCKPDIFEQTYERVEADAGVTP